MNKGLSSGWLVGLRGQLPSHPRRWPFPNPLRPESRGGPLQPRPSVPAFLDKVVQVRLKRVQPQRPSGLGVIHADGKAVLGVLGTDL